MNKTILKHQEKEFMNIIHMYLYYTAKCLFKNDFCVINFRLKYKNILYLLLQ